MEPPPEVIAAAANWDQLSRWERAELGRGLRRQGWTYGEIMEILPVIKGTLAGWCREIRLTEEQIEAIKTRRPAGVRTGIPVDTQRKRRGEIEAIRVQARSEAQYLVQDPIWLAGVVLYWAEGSKTNNRLEVANSDLRLLQIFMRWARTYHRSEARFSAALNLHADNDEPAAKKWWSDNLRIPICGFGKTFVKPDGTGHRKNHLPVGVCRVTMRKSSDALHRTFGWIDGVAIGLIDDHD